MVRNVRGTSYVEVLVAVALLGLVFGPLLGLVLNGRRVSDRAVWYGRAAVIAESRWEQVRVTAYDQVVADTVADDEGWECTVMVVEVERGVKDVTVVVSRDVPDIEVRLVGSVSRR